ncbi:hypothetical protein [Streptomyces sp. NPDC051286]|uniref:hypothetical protein n=1 Tax=Streptomyces sp. NPDC051286 TaxID=3365647 RepID=UPI003793E533
MLAKAGRTEEAAAVLERHPTINSSLRAERLIDLGRIEDAVRVLQQPMSKPTTPAWDGAYSTEPPF